MNTQQASAGLHTAPARTFDQMAFIDDTRMKVGSNFWAKIKANPKASMSVAAVVAVTATAMTLVSLKVPSVNDFFTDIGTHIKDYAQSGSGQLCIAGFASGALALGVGNHQAFHAILSSSNTELKALMIMAKYVELGEVGQQLNFKRNGPYDNQKALNIWGAVAPIGHYSYGKLLSKVNNAIASPRFDMLERATNPLAKELSHILKQTQMRKLFIAAIMIPAATALFGIAAGTLNDKVNSTQGAGIGVVPGLLVAVGLLYLGQSTYKQDKAELESASQAAMVRPSVFQRQDLNSDHAAPEYPAAVVRSEFNSSRDFLLQDMQPVGRSVHQDTSGIRIPERSVSHRLNHGSAVRRQDFQAIFG